MFVLQDLQDYTKLTIPRSRDVLIIIGTVAKCLHRNGYKVEAWAWGEMHITPHIDEVTLNKLLYGSK